MKALHHWHATSGSMRHRSAATWLSKALHTASTAKEAAFDADSFRLLASGDSENTTLGLSDGVMMLVVSIIHAHLQGEPTLAQAGALLGAGVAEHVRSGGTGLSPLYASTSATEHALVLALSSACGIEHAGMEPAFDFNDWLARAAQTGLVTGTHRLHPRVNSKKYLWPL